MQLEWLQWTEHLVGEDKEQLDAYTPSNIQWYNYFVKYLGSFLKVRDTLMVRPTISIPKYLLMWMKTRSS